MQVHCTCDWTLSSHFTFHRRGHYLELNIEPSDIHMHLYSTGILYVYSTYTRTCTAACTVHVYTGEMVSGELCDQKVEAQHLFVKDTCSSSVFNVIG